MSGKERAGSLQVIEFVASTKLEETSDSPPCLACGHTMDKAFIEHSCSVGNTEIHSSNVAGYRCSRDGVETYSHEGVIEVMDNAKKFAERVGDQESVRIFTEASDRSRSILEQQKLAKPREVISA